LAVYKLVWVIVRKLTALDQPADTKPEQLPNNRKTAAP